MNLVQQTERNTSVRVQRAQKAITHADLTDSDTSQKIDFAAALPTNAVIIASYLDVTEAFAYEVAAVAATKATNTVDAPFEMITDGQTVVIDVDNGGDATATFNIAQAVAAGSGLAITDIDGETLVLAIDSGEDQTITFGSGDTDAATAAATINSQIIGASAVVDTGEIKIYSDTYGTGSHVNIKSGTALTELGLSVADNVGTGDAADGHNVTIAEIKTWLEGDISGITVTDIGSNRFSITSDTTGATSELDFKTSTAFTALGLSVETLTGTAAISGTMTADLAADTDGDADALIDGGDVSTAIAKINGPKGVASDGFYGGKTPAVTFAGSSNLDLYTAGELTANILYVDVTDIAS